MAPSNFTFVAPPASSALLFFYSSPVLKSQKVGCHSSARLRLIVPACRFAERPPIFKKACSGPIARRSSEKMERSLGQVLDVVFEAMG